MDTLVFVPDGALRAVPMAALQDRETKRYLIDRYAIAVTLGLTLVDPAPAPRQGATALRGGLSKGSKDFPPLQFVPAELENLGRLYAGPQLLDGKRALQYAR